jgi:digeranylgeranylglycerophospholipid reductase
MDEKYDCIVVGAGPAGSMGAKTLAENGLEVLLLEKHPKIGIPLSCAEGISTTGLSQFITPDPEWICTRIHKALLVSPSQERFTLHHPHAGFVLDRKVFDKRLAQKAVSSGAQLKVNSCAVGLLSQKGGGFCGVKVREDGEEKEYRSRVIIAADGVESLVARWAGMDSYLKLDQIESSAQYLLEEIEVEPDRLEFYLGQSVAPGGYAWVFPKGENSANVGLAISPTRTEKRAKELLDRFVQKRFPRFKKLELTMGGVPSFNRKRGLVQQNLLLVGDAARVVDSLSGAGISNALLSGKLAGEIVSQFLKGRMSSLSSLKKYEDELLKKKGRELRFYSYCRAIFLKMTDEDFDMVVRFLGDYFERRTVTSIQPIALVKTILKSNRRLLRLLKHLVW